MDGCRPVSRAGRADEAGKPSVSIPTAHATQTGRVDRDTETGTQIHTPQPEQRGAEGEDNYA